MGGYSVKDLAEYMRRAKKEQQPFVLFTGAGCSKSAGIPLAGELVAEMNKNYELYLKDLSAEDRADYSKCMSVLPKHHRRALLQGYMKKAKINWAHIVQALLMEQGYVQRVLTFNFDNILSRSCGLLGLYPSTYDFTSANLKLQNLIVDPAIVHLHGQSHGFVQINDDEETRQHTRQLSAFIAGTLNQSPSIFIGYSGKADAFFPLLKDHFSDQSELFWVGRTEQVPSHVQDDLIGPMKVAHYLHHEDADLFFIDLARELECFPPKIFEDPFGHLLDELKSVLDFPIQEKPEVDILASTKATLKDAQSEMKSNERPNFELLFMQGKYKEAISQAKTLKLKENEKEFVSLSQVALGNRLLKIAEKTKNPDLYKQSIEKYKDALTTKPTKYGAIGNIGNALVGIAELEQKPELFEQSIKNTRMY